MSLSTLAKRYFVDVINSLPSEVLPELACSEERDTSEYIREEKKYGGADVEAVRCC